MKGSIKRKAFGGCAAHKTLHGKGFRYDCHGCLVATVGNLCDLVEELEKK